MKIRRTINDPTPAESSGAALVIILAFVVLMMGLVVAFFSRAITERQVSNSSANQTKADILARGALDVITGDLKQEIVFGSTVAAPSPSPAAGVTYIPKSNLYMKPVKDAALNALIASGSNIIPNLIRTSGTSQLVINGTTVYGSGSPNAASTGTSTNGRSITLDRWNSHYLVPRKNAGTGNIDTMPIDSFSGVAPSWVMVTNQGPQVLNSPTNTVIGRYAYAIYDESMLLDMNVAGFPSSSGTKAIAGKASIAYADLTQIGVQNPDTSGAYQMDNIVGWRNYTTIKPSGSSQSLGSYDFHTAAVTGTNYDKFVASATNGFLTTPGTTYNNRTDQAFTSRQSLLKFARAQNISQDALQYMGTFSRAITTPSWAPSTPAPSSSGTSNIDYAAIADSGTAQNRNLANVRFKNAVTVSHYNDDGVKVTYNVQSGDPLIQRRFSLAKLAWIAHTGPSANLPHSDPQYNAGGTPEAILACFGLTWNPSKSRWDYNHGSATGILLLDQIVNMSTPREPDFFELLKVGILKGSLGNQPGPVKGIAPQTGEQGPVGLAFDSFSANRDRQILQIGVNTIDQTTPNNYPTAIYQGNVDRPEYAGNGELELFNTVFGDKNLPMLSRMTVVSYVTTGTFEGVWMQPEVWNPHDSSTSGTSPTDSKYPTPKTLRLVTYGGCKVTLKESSPTNSGTQTIDFGTDTTNPNLGGIICFMNPMAGSTSPTPDFFDSPQLLSGYGTDQRFHPDFYQDTSFPSGPNNKFYYRTTGTKQRWLGVWLADMGRDEVTYTASHSIDVDPTGNPAPGEPHLTFVLEYHDGTAFHPYTMMARVNEPGGAGYSSNSLDGIIGWGAFNAGHPDPRTDRFSASGGGVDRAGSHNYPWNGGNTIRVSELTTNVNNGRGAITTAVPHTIATPGFPTTVFTYIGKNLVDNWSQNLAVATSGTYCWYSDPDGIVRPGDSWRSNTTGTNSLGTPTAITGDGEMLYHETANYANSNPRRRPVVLNRPFRSIGELAFVFRDQPFKTLDFWSDKSADAGLLDLFSISEEPVLVAGKISPGAAPLALQAVINGALKQENSGLICTGTGEAAAIAQSIYAELSGTGGPIANPADLATRLSKPVHTGLTTFTGTTSDPSPNDNKTYGETFVRALAPVANTRTWNLLIDVIAQSGHHTVNARTLNDFVVEGEKRYWLHLAIDRITGKVVDQQLEPVYD